MDGETVGQAVRVADAAVGAVSTAAGSTARPELTILSGLVLALFGGFSGLLVTILRLWRDSVRDQGRECREAIDGMTAEVRRLADRIAPK